VRQTAGDDIVRPFRDYLLTVDAPEIAVRFREAVRRTIQSLNQNPHVGPRYSSSNTDAPILKTLRGGSDHFLRGTGKQPFLDWRILKCNGKPSRGVVP
jgi:plasmid stabilization system protein ParE